MKSGKVWTFPTKDARRIALKTLDKCRPEKYRFYKVTERKQRETKKMKIAVITLLILAILLGVAVLGALVTCAAINEAFDL